MNSDPVTGPISGWTDGRWPGLWMLTGLCSCRCHLWRLDTGTTAAIGLHTGLHGAETCSCSLQPSDCTPRPLQPSDYTPSQHWDLQLFTAAIGLHTVTTAAIRLHTFTALRPAAVHCSHRTAHLFFAAIRPWTLLADTEVSPLHLAATWLDGPVHAARAVTPVCSLAGQCMQLGSDVSLHLTRPV